MPNRSLPCDVSSISLAFCLLLVASDPVAADSPDRALKRVEERYLPKVQHACGISLSVEYDTVSLRAHNDDILHDQTELSEFYLNGKAKLKELHDKPEHKQVEEYWDTGKLRRQGGFVGCRSYDGWCAEGVHRSFFEDGRLSAEESYKLGQEHGAQRRWWPNGKLRAEEQYVDGRRTKSKRWDEQGKLSADEEYEADGSRKLK